MFSLRRNKDWKNWAGTVYNRPEALLYPKSLSDVVSIVKTCKAQNKKLRVIGAGHSFTPLAASSEVLISLDHLSGIVDVDDAHHRVTVWGGTRLSRLGQLLYDKGYAMENLGDINVQSIAGAISTGTHGTGVTFGSLSTQVSKLTIVTPNGDVINVSATENSGVFQAGRLSLGMLGIIVKVELAVVTSYMLDAESYRLELSDCLDNLDELRHSNRNFEFFWFPHTHTVQVKVMNAQMSSLSTPSKTTPNLSGLLVENGAFWALSELCRAMPSFSKTVSHVSAKAVPTGQSSGMSHDMYATPRLVKFTEMEYSVRAEQMADVIEDIQRVINQNNFNVHFPIECRYVKKDDIWLSPAYERDAAYIAVHMYKGMDYQPYFDAIEEVFRHYDGRPHWGKMHTMSAQQLYDTYLKLEAFMDVRKKLDPNGMLLNGYLREMFGL
ncbi:D-arabinono-1,4-lactone oxidase [Lentibacillus saliphilus]|uniref:D-arabinono-1,4-lactone oxidase n=1 Tax=Lentibacillus saliphilus TaxID=2737028 RepID=UPI001C306BDA|nr:D-arabinono-1,4-lactone oxidase [Lentibacillus saliphilus]